MSFHHHRVLPLLSDHALRDPWAIQPDTLLSSKIMPDETTSRAAAASQQDQDTSTSTAPAAPTRGGSLSSPPPPKEEEEEEGGALKSPAEEESLDDYESPKYRTHPQSLAARVVANRPSGAGQLSVPQRKSVVEKWQEESPSSICLCQPDPKVPRPRNAFILYRQHHQQAVVAQNPGLANPEISKIIGDHWRNSPLETKEHWKLLADEEKLRHQKQYPDYRYQPRRSIRNGSVSGSNATSSSADGDHRLCQKCGRRSIAASTVMMMSGPGLSSSNPATPYSPSGGQQQQQQPPNSAASAAGRFMRGLGSPPTSNPTGNAAYRHRPSSTTTTAANVASLTLSSPNRFKRHDSGLPSPRFKRPEPGPGSPRSPDSKRRRITNASYAPVRAAAANNPTTPFPFPSHQRRQSLPRPDFMGPGISSPFTMGPPPRPHQHAEASLTLAPLQNPSSGTDTQAKSLEAMIMSIPTLGKIRVLSKISPPLAPPGPTSPVRPTRRGLIIALDAADPASLDALTSTIQTTLTSYAPRVFQTPHPPASAPPSFQSYLRLMDAYHTLSTQLIDHVTSPPPTTTTGNDNDNPMESPPPISPKSFPVPKAGAGAAAAVTPIAIVPGWQVTWSDWFASRVEIKDAYSPMDHWQWAATLWRNVVGADVTVAVQAPETPEKEKEKEKEKVGPVEVRLEDARAVIVRGEREGGGVPEGGLRRVGFEIGEWVRGWEEKGGELR